MKTTRIPKRYDIEADFTADHPCVYTDESEDGEWVKWEDVAGLLDEISELEDRVAGLKALMGAM